MDKAIRNSVFWKVVTYIAYFFYATFPFFIVSSMLYYGSATRSLTLCGVSFAFGIAYAVWLVASEKASLSIMKSPILGAVLVYGLTLSVSAYGGLNGTTSFWSVVTRMTGLWYMSALIIFMFALWQILRECEVHKKLVLVVTISTTLYSLLYLFNALGLLPLSTADGFTFANSSFAGMYLFGAFLLAIYYALQASVKRWWMYALPIVIASSPATLNVGLWRLDFSSGIMGQAQASTIAVWLSLPVLGVFLLIARVKDARQRKLIDYSLFSVGVIAAVLAAFSLFSPNGYLRELYLKNSSAARPLVWQISERAIGERPWLGWGTDNFERVFERHFDNRLLEDAYGKEAWFDRAHNVFIDQAVDNGLIGLTAYLAIYVVTILCLMYVARASKIQEDRLFAEVLIIYFLLHLAELQTAFDTSISYPLFAFMLVSAGVLYERTRQEQKKHTNITPGSVMKYVAAFALLLYCGWSVFFGLIPIVRAEIANGAVRSGASASERLPKYDALFGSPLDKQGFAWRIMTDFERGIQANPKALENPANVASFKKEMTIYENAFRQVLVREPQNFRAHLSLANVLIYQNLFQVNKLQEAQDVLDKAIALSPQSPQPYWMKAVTYVYMRKFPEARAYAQKGLAINPNIKQSQVIVQYVEQSARTFPNLILYFFSFI